MSKGDCGDRLRGDMDSRALLSAPWQAAQDLIASMLDAAASANLGHGRALSTQTGSIEPGAELPKKTSEERRRFFPFLPEPHVMVQNLRLEKCGQAGKQGKSPPG